VFRLRLAIMQRQLDVAEAFRIADADNAGLLSGGKLAALHDFLDVEVDDAGVVDFLRMTGKVRGGGVAVVMMMVMMLPAVVMVITMMVLSAWPETRTGPATESDQIETVANDGTTINSDATTPPRDADSTGGGREHGRDVIADVPGVLRGAERVRCGADGG
jgi:hypothetical protein